MAVVILLLLVQTYQHINITLNNVNLTNKNYIQTITTPTINAGAQLKNGATSAGFLESPEDSDNGTSIPIPQQLLMLLLHYLQVQAQ